MECGKLTAKLRDMVTVRFYEDDTEIKRYHNIELPDEIKAMPFKGYEFSVPLDGAITFKIWLEENPAEWPEPRTRKTRKPKDVANEPVAEEPVTTMPEAEETATEKSAPEVHIDEEDGLMSVKYQGDRKALVTAIGEILDLPVKYLALPSYAYEIGGEYRVLRDGTLVGTTNKDLVAKLAEMGFIAE